MSSVTSEHGQSAPGESAPPAPVPGRRIASQAGWLVVALYLLASFALTWRLWADPAGRMVAGNPGDIGLFAWFMRYSATAISHGRLPGLVTTAINAPQGISLMWNTSVLLPGIVLAPLTLLAGPQASLTVLLTAGYAGSAASLFYVLRRWGANTAAAALGGTVYGFSPALIAAGMGHFQLQFAALPPLIIDALLRILTGRGHAMRNGVGLGLLVAAQFFIGQELLADTALTALVMVAVLAVGQPRVAFRTARKLVRTILAGLGAAAVTAALICGYPLWEQFNGPLATNGSPWQVSEFYNHLYPFVTPSGSMLFHTSASAAAAAAYPEPAPEYVAYLGWPLLGVLLVVAVGFWRDPRIRLAALTCALLELCSLGNVRVAAVPLWVLPWHWLQHVPVLEDVLPDRFSILADGAAAAALAFALSRILARPRHTWPRRLTGTLAAAVAVLAVLPIVPRPLAVADVPPPPPGWQATFAKLNLPPGAPVLIVPDLRFPLRWQAETGVPGSMIGGGDITEPGPGGHAASYIYTRRATARYLYSLWLSSPVGSTTGSPPQQTGPASQPSQPQIRGDLAYWRLAAIVAATVPGSPLARFLTREFGPPTVALGDVLAWREPRLTGHTVNKGN